MTIIEFIIIALATYRISSLIAKEDGPADILAWFRWRVGVKINKQGDHYGSNSFAEGMICQWCNSIWIAITLTIVYLFIPVILFYILLPFALSSVTIVITEYTNG